MKEDNRGLLQKAFNWFVYNPQERSSLENPQVPLNDATLETLWGFDPEDKPVNLQNSLSITAFLRAVNLRADTQASLPFNVFTVDENDDRSVDKNHPAYGLLNEEFNPTMGSFEARKVMQSHIDTVGNAFAEIVRKGNGDPKELWVLDPDTVKLFFRGRKLFYEVGGEYRDGELVKKGRMISADNMFHVKGFSYDGYVGIAPMALAKDALGIAISANAFVNRFYKNNAMPSMVVSVNQMINKETSDQIKERWEESYGGSKQGKTAVLGQGASITPMTMPLDQAQMVDIMRHSVIEISRMFGVPPHMLFEMERETFTNIETATIGWVRDVVRPNSVEWEQEANRKLLRNIQRRRRSHFTEHDLFGLLRGDSVATANLAQSLHSISAISANEVRKIFFNWNEIGEQGDKYVLQQGFAPVDQIVEKMDADIANAKKETQDPVTDKDTDTDGEE